MGLHLIFGSVDDKSMQNFATGFGAMALCCPIENGPWFWILKPLVCQNQGNKNFLEP